MDAKKSTKANLESHISLFFLFGLAAALLFAIIVLQYNHQFNDDDTSETLIIVNTEADIPITVHPIKEDFKKPVEKRKVRNSLPPVILDDSLFMDTIAYFEPITPISAPVTVKMEEEEVEVLPHILIEKMARPEDCAGYGDRDAQYECLNSWLNSYIVRNTKYPEEARRMNLEDRVYVTFIISEKGELESAEIGKGQYEVLNEEALRVIRTLPLFVPGSQQGRPVKMKMSVPVNFKLSTF